MNQGNKLKKNSKDIELSSDESRYNSAPLPYPRIVIAGASGDSGKTLISLGLLSYFLSQGMSLAAFKKGPDYIDSAWLGEAIQGKARNLDPFLMGEDSLLSCFLTSASGKELSIIEGNRGLCDGVDVEGSFSTAKLARLLDAPVILIVNVTKMTRTCAALVLGCKMMEPEVNIAGVILNKVAGTRHGRVAGQAIESYTGIPIVGSVPKLSEDFLPSRHLGLIMPREHPRFGDMIHRIESKIIDHINVDRILEIARSASVMQSVPVDLFGEAVADEKSVRIAFFCDQAFSFYYPENLEALVHHGAELVPVSSIDADQLPNDIQGLYIGGGFPELLAERVSSNQSLRRSVKDAAEAGLPIYAECGGMVYLSDELFWEERQFPMAGVLPISIRMHPKPQGHGYSEILVDRDNPFFNMGERLLGHEFHYSRIVSGFEKIYTVYKLKKGTGCYEMRDGITYKNVLASYVHLHALGSSSWAPGFVQAAVRYKKGS